MPGVVDLSELTETAEGVARIVLQSVQDMLLRLALQMARDNYETQRERQRQGIELAKRANKYAGRPTDNAMHERIAALRTSGHSIAYTARLAGCSTSWGTCGILMSGDQGVRRCCPCGVPAPDMRA